MWEAVPPVVCPGLLLMLGRVRRQLRHVVICSQGMEMVPGVGVLMGARSEPAMHPFLGTVAYMHSCMQVRGPYEC